MDQASRPIAPLPKRVQQVRSASMSVQTTPEKSTAISDKIEELNHHWQLGIPTGKAGDSPIRGGSHDEARKALRWVQYFVHSQRVDQIDEVVEDFKARASLINTDWSFKPGADPDTTLRRRSSELPEHVKGNVSSNQRELLLKCFNACFQHQEAKSKAAQSPPPKVAAVLKPDHRPGPKPPMPVHRPNDMVKSKALEPTQASHQGRIDNFFKVRQERSPVNAGQDVPMPDAEEKMLEQFQKVHLDVFSTPHESESDEGETEAHTLFKETTDTVGVKRPMPPSDEPVPRKSSRSSSTNGAFANAQAHFPVKIYDRAANTAPPKPVRTQPPSAVTSTVPSANTSFAHSVNTSFTSMTSGSPVGTAATSPALAHINTVPPVKPEPLRSALGPQTVAKQTMEALVPPQPKNPNPMVGPEPLEVYIKRCLLNSGTFRDLVDFRKMGEKPSFRLAYEVTRVSLHTGVPARDLFGRLQSNKLLSLAPEEEAKQYSKIWHLMRNRVDQDRKSMPERSPADAWEAAEKSFSKVSLTGALQFNTTQEGPLLKLQLHPLKKQQSFRLKRRFGGHRFLQIGIPGLSQRDLPEFLKPCSTEVRPYLVSWLIGRVHELLGRSWRAFCTKGEKGSAMRKTSSKSLSNEPRTKLYLFAENGYDFSKDSPDRSSDISSVSSPPICSVERMVEWFMDVQAHGSMSSLKLFARLALGVGTTTPTIEISMTQIARSDDAVSSKPKRRTLDWHRSEEKKKGQNVGAGSVSEGAVMNDGCARISRDAARHIAYMLGLQDVPSAIHGRIGGAKGLWMVDSTGETFGGRTKKDVWIEVTDSQLKFDWHIRDKTAFAVDKQRLTFEVCSWSSPIQSKGLNFQLMPVLVNRGVPSAYLEDYFAADVSARAAEAKVAVNSPSTLGLWCQEKESLLNRRSADGSIGWLGGAPQSPAERLNLMIQSGFRPLECHFLHDLMLGIITKYYDRLLEKGSIGVPCSCSVLCIADPIGVLAEGEVHLAFSTKFVGDERDPNSEIGFRRWSGNQLYDRDILVTRSPTHLPSDVQRVRAVSKPELLGFKDVIIFSSRGKQALADKLSGGDYDGDTILVIWDPGVVESFQNAECPAPTSPELYGAKKDKTTINDLGEGATAKMLQKGLEYSLRPEMLGSATNYRKKLDYHRWTKERKGRLAVEQPDTVELAQLLGFLVDAPKAGLTFDEDDFHAYKKSKGLQKDYEPPAYESGRKIHPKDSSHPIDRAKAKGKAEIEKALEDLKDGADEIPKYDKALSGVFAEQDDIATTEEPVLKAVLTDLKERLQEIHDFWRVEAPPSEDGGGACKSGMSFPVVAERTRQRFLDLQPADVDHPMVRFWKREQAARPDAPDSHWLRLKASTLYRFYHARGKFVWWAAMRELCALKAFAAGAAPTPVVPDVLRVSKIDPKAVRRLENANAEERLTMFEEVLEDEYGDDELDDTALLACADAMNYGQEE